MSNYSENEVKEMLEVYTANPCRESVNILAEKMGRSVKSVIGKLSREGVYRREKYLTKTGENPVTKVEILEEIAEKLDLDVTKLSGLEKAPKPVLKLLAERVGLS